jgi:hypothetical protein
MREGGAGGISQENRTGRLCTSISIYHKVLTYVEYRAVSGVFQNIDPHPLSTQRVCPPRIKGGGYTLSGRWRVNSLVVWKTPDIGLTSYSLIPLQHIHTESIVTFPQFSLIEGHKWFFQISSQWESQKNRLTFTSLKAKSSFYLRAFEISHSCRTASAVYPRGYKEMSSILPNQYSTLVYEPKWGGRGGVARSQPMSIQLYTGAQINFRDITPYLIYEYTCTALPISSGTVLQFW